MKEIGGYFELELAKNDEYHEDAIKLNTGRNSLEYVLKSNRYKKIYIPFYICDSILEPITKVGIKYEYYHIDEGFNIKLDLTKLEKDELLLYVNYFGICTKQVKKLLNGSTDYEFDICIDNTQAFYNMPKGEQHTLYSARKFFGVFDGAYLYTKNKFKVKLEKEISYDKSDYLLKRIDLGASHGYADFKSSSKYHSNQPIKQMSNLSRRILQSIDYKKCAQIRMDNFKYLHQMLKAYNSLELDMESIECPMVYPLYIDRASLIRKTLISQGVFVAQYWPGVTDKVNKFSHEMEMVEKIIPLPIDQRYNIEDMEYIVQIIKCNLE